MKTTERNYSIPQLAAIAQRDRRWIERKLGGNATAGGKFKLSDVLSNLCAENPPSEADLKETADRQRKAAAEADLAEMKMLDKAGKIIPRETFQGALNDWAIKTAQYVCALRLSKKDRDAVLAVMRKGVEEIADALASSDR